MNTTLWMGDVEPFWDENFIRGAFSHSGEQPTAVKLMKNKLTGGQARYCFVDFRDSAAAERVMSICNGKPVPNSTPPRMFKLNFAVYGMQAPPNFNRKEFSLFVGELSPEVDDYALYNFFSRRYPSIKGAKVIMDNAGMSRGFGFVRFGSEEEQQRALNEMQNASGLGGRSLRVSIATPKKPKVPGPGGEGPDPWSSGVGSWNSGGGGGGGGSNTWNAEGNGSSWNSGGGQYAGSGGSQGGWGSQQNTWNSGQGSWESGSNNWGGGSQQGGSWSGNSTQPSGWGSGGGQQPQQSGWSGNQESSWGGGSTGGGGSQSGWGQGQGQQYGQGYQGYQY
ncbi:tRNA selenocysteine 1-associated protein 1-like isoform X2 [Saccoglossus kowalevskii]|uniref:tRNA selenocysteine-associated protein 1 n=1 Tax=Saccoglossus kowalevskii TaxID=10224 RepID=A0ABM0GPA4_SACKO|nr:PREDICTED: tRNA selenocysteine 1-associated protein 1-like isoform 2 [Saccoglossus kowalevskii]